MLIGCCVDRCVYIPIYAKVTKKVITIQVEKSSDFWYNNTNKRRMSMGESEVKKVMKFYNMSDFLKGQSSKIITQLSEKDEAAFILKNGKPKAVVLSNERYERLLKAGIDLLEY